MYLRAAIKFGLRISRVCSLKQGTILLAVNPLKKIPEPAIEDFMNRSLDPERPHPYAIAEVRSSDLRVQVQLFSIRMTHAVSTCRFFVTTACRGRTDITNSLSYNVLKHAVSCVGILLLLVEVMFASALFSAAKRNIPLLRKRPIKTAVIFQLLFFWSGAVFLSLTYQCRVGEFM